MIIYLDDSLDDLELLKRALKKKGKDLRIFSREEDFNQSVTEKTFAVIIDHNLNSGRTGLDVMRDILAKYPACHPIIVSDNNDGRLIIQYMNSDAFRFVYKNDKGWDGTVVKYVEEAKERLDLVMSQLKRYKFIK